MIKHVGRHNNRKIVIVYRQVPGEDHMALITYSDVLPRMVHDELMKCVEGVVAQNTKDVADVLFRTLMANGEGILQSLHANGWMKKVPCNQVIVTPTATASIRLDELNKMLNEMEQGEEAVKKLADLDSQRGMRGNAEKDLFAPPNSRAGAADIPANVDVLTDADLANQRLNQAADMKRQAEQLLAEAKRLEQEAKELSPNVRTTAKKTTSKKKQTA
jgi:prefoldin subunit 5